MIKTVFHDQHDLLKAIIKLYIPARRFGLDATYGRGNFYKKGIQEPKWAIDIDPKSPLCPKGDCTKLELAEYELESIIFDPPFLFGTTTGKMATTYGAYKSSADLYSFYAAAGDEFWRVLKPGGILVFKCQDLVNGRRQYWSHCEIWKMMTEIGFRGKDLFVLVNENLPTPHNYTNQVHARKSHSFFWVFRKPC